MTDDRGNTAPGAVAVEYVGVNHPPLFTPCQLDDASILEEAPINTPVINVRDLFTDYLLIL